MLVCHSQVEFIRWFWFFVGFVFGAFEAARCSVCPDLLKCAVLFYLSTYFIFLIKIRMISCSVTMLRAHSPVLCTEACWQRAAHKHSLNLHFIQAFPFNYRDQFIFYFFIHLFFVYTGCVFLIHSKKWLRALNRSSLYYCTSTGTQSWVKLLWPLSHFFF